MPESRPAKLTFILLLFISLLGSCQYFRPLADSGPSPSPKKAPSESSLRNEIVDYAYKLRGAKYRYGGKSRNSGFDCSGFVCHVLNEYGIAVSGASYMLENQGEKIALDEVQPGDLLFFRKSKGGRVFHVSLVLSNDHGKTALIHATSGRGVVVDVLQESSYWNSKVITARDVISARAWHAKALP
ncbi:MAG: hydrolase [Saprospirales bacterium]|nr:hydrolase [Saprospirales bacterium]